MKDIICIKPDGFLKERKAYKILDVTLDKDGRVFVMVDNGENKDWYLSIRFMSI